MKKTRKEKEYERDYMQIRDMVDKGILNEEEHKRELDLLQKKYRD